jgi:hypothetical protein
MHFISSQQYFIEHYAAMLIQEADKLYNKLVKERTMGITYDPAFSGRKSSSSDGTTAKSSFPPPKSAAQY